MAKEMRRATIGFSVKGNLESLEKANKLLDEMPKKAAKITGMLNKAFSNDGLKNIDKLGKAYSKVADKSQDAVDKIVKQNKRASQSTEESATKATKSVEAFNKKMSLVDSSKLVEIKTKYNDEEATKAQRAADKLGRTSPLIKVKTNAKQESQQATEAVQKYSSNAKRYFRNAGEAAGQFMSSGFQKAKNKLHELDQQAGTSEHLFSKIFSSTLISNAILSSWSALTGKIKEAAKAGLDYEKDQDQMLATWTTLGGSEKVARRMRKNINNYSTETGQDTDLVNEEEQGFYHLHSNEKESNTMTHAMLNMTDAVGLTKEQAKSVSQDMVHTLAGGVVQTGDLNVIGQYFPMFNEAMEKYMAKVKHVKKVSGKDLREMAKTGKISAADYEKVFEHLGNVKYGAAAERMMGTFKGMERTIKSRVPALMGKMEEPFLTQESGLYRGISKWVAAKKTEREFQELGKAINTSVDTIAKAFSSTFKLGSSSQVMDNLMSKLTKGVIAFGDSVKHHAPDIKVFFEAMKTTSGASLKVMVQALKDLLPVLKVIGDFVNKHPKLFGTWAAGIIMMNGATKVFRSSLVGIIATGKLLGAPIKLMDKLGRGLQRIKLGPKAEIDPKPFSNSLTTFFKNSLEKVKTGMSSLKGAFSKNITPSPIETDTTTNAEQAATGTAGKAAPVAGGFKGFAKGAVKTVGYGALIDVGASFGSEAYNAIHKGLKSESGKSSAWTMGGEAVGAGLGAWIAGPVGAGYGGEIGRIIGKGFSKTAIAHYVEKTHTSDHKKATHAAKEWTSKKAENRTKTSLSGAYANTRALDTLDPTLSDKIGSAYNKNTGSSKKSGSKKATAKKKPVNPFDSLPKDARKATKQATSLIQDANADWTKSEGLWHAGTAKSRAASNKMQAKSDSSYTQAYNVLEKYANNTHRSTSKSASYLEKLGLISKNQASSALSSEQGGDAKRLTAIRNTMAKLKTSERNGGSDRFRLQQRLNGEILRLTDKGGKKRNQLMARLNSQTTRLSSKQYRSITGEAKKATNTTVRAANKQYKVTKTRENEKYTAVLDSANKQYRKTKSAAAAVYGKNSKMYNKIVDKAGKTRDAAIDKAEKQREKVVSEANSQRKETIKAAKNQHSAVVREAQKQAGDLVDTFSDLAGNTVSAFKNSASVEFLLNQNAKATGGKYTSHPKTDDQAMMDHFGAPNLKSTKTKPGAKSVNVKSGIGSTSKKSSGAKLTVGPQIGSYAAGNAITKRQMAMVGENGFEILQRNRQFRLIGKRGAQMMAVQPGDQIYKHADAQRMMRGTYGQRLRGFANGTTSLGSFAIGGGDTGKVKTGIDGTKKKYDKELKGSKRSIASFKQASKTSFAKVKSDTTSKIGTMSAKVQKSYKSMSGNVNGTAKGLSSSLSHRTSSMASNMTHKVKNMGSDLEDITSSISKQWRKTWSNMVSYFGTVMTRLKPYAHKGMSGAVTALNGGISSIDTALGQFGGNKSVLKPIHYATGSKGPIPSDQLAVLNDATSGPRQELVLRGNKLLKPEGQNTMAHLKKGDHVLNGRQAQRFLPHYAKGTGLSDNALIDLATKNSGNPKAAFNSEFDKHIGKGGTSVLSKGILKTAKGAVDSLGTAWSSAMWSLINNTIQGGGTGNGSLKPHFGGKFTESSGYGRRTGDVSDFHKGIDFAAPMGTPIPAQYAGTVITAGSASGFGNWVVIRPTGQDINTIYGHMRSYSVHAGQHVKAGQIIARVGAEGEATGPHVHYELRKGLGSGDSRPNPDTYKGKVKKLPKGGKGLNGLVKRELGSKALKWIEDHLQSDVSSISMSGSVAERARSLAKAIKRLYPSATNAGIAAVLGNWSFESGLNPNAINPGGGASGLGQWLGGRKTALINYGSKHGKNWKNAGTQLAFALNGDGSDSSLLKSILRGGGSVSSLAARFSNGWERGGYTAQHVDGARKIEAALHNAGGWSVPGKLNVFGERDPEVAINPKMPNADGLIASAIDKRSKVNGSGLAGQLKRAVANQEAKPKRQSLYKQAISGLRNVATGVHKSSGSVGGSKIVISPTFNFNGNTDTKTAHEFADYSIAQLRKLVQQEIQRHERATYVVTSD